MFSCFAILTQALNRGGNLEKQFRGCLPGLYSRLMRRKKRIDSRLWITMDHGPTYIAPSVSCTEASGRDVPNLIESSDSMYQGTSRKSTWWFGPPEGDEETCLHFELTSYGPVDTKTGSHLGFRRRLKMQSVADFRLVTYMERWLDVYVCKVKTVELKSCVNQLDLTCLLGSWLVNPKSTSFGLSFTSLGPESNMVRHTNYWLDGFRPPTFHVFGKYICGCTFTKLITSFQLWDHSCKVVRWNIRMSHFFLISPSKNK